MFDSRVRGAWCEQVWCDIPTRRLLSLLQNITIQALLDLSAAYQLYDANDLISLSLFIAVTISLKFLDKF